jgi:PAS domain S-box-containing protein
LAYCHKQVQVADHYETEYRFRDASGNWRWIHDVVTVSRRDGHPEFLRGFMVDISASREVEEALRLSEGRLRSVMEHAPDIIIQVDREHKIQFINRILEPFALENTLGTQVEAWIPPSDSDSVRSEIDRVFATGNSGNYFTRFDHPTDGELWCSCNVGAVRVDGHVDSVILISRDITYQKRAEIAMRESEQLYRLLADHSSDMIARIYPNGVFAYVSPSAEIITGYRPEELLGKNFENLVPAEEIPRLYQEIGGVVNERREHVVTYRLIRKDGRVIWAESKGQPVVDPITNQVTELIVNTRDVTDRLEAARRLREREYHLAHAERLATMGQMASELAHEINQPLYAIANFADACNSTMEAASPSAADDVANWLTQIAIQARRASDIVRRINHFVRKGDAERSVFQINDCVHDVIPLFEINARRDGIRLELELQSDLPPVFADRLLLEQVLTNLIRNGLESIHEAEPKHKRLLVRTYFADGQGIFVAVTDNGTGIPQDRFEHLFEPYFTSKQDGTGMGLSICRATIEAHGGRIWATNNQERGATFQFLIPATTKNPAQSLKNSGPE